MQGSTPRSLEVGGTDLGAGGATSSNFGIGQLSVGKDDAPTTLVLLDAIDNGNRSGLTETDDEVLYLYGVGGQDGLRVHADSVVVLYGVDVYAFETGVGQVHLNALFPMGDNEIDYDEGTLRLIELIDGDFNGDGFVDAAYYTLWRDTLGLSGVRLRADVDGDGTVTTLDYDIWKASFGNNVFDGLGGVAAASAVPEPAAMLLAIVTTAIIGGLHRRRK